MSIIWIILQRKMDFLTDHRDQVRVCSNQRANDQHHSKAQDHDVAIFLVEVTELNSVVTLILFHPSSIRRRIHQDPILQH